LATDVHAVEIQGWFDADLFTAHLELDAFGVLEHRGLGSTGNMSSRFISDFL
jgi:hypothetical protein